MKIVLLIISDDLVREVIREILVSQRQDIQILEAMEGLAALELALTQLPDLIIFSGKSLLEDFQRILESLRQEQTTMHIPIIGISGDPNGKAGHILQRLSDTFIAKPFSVESLLQTVTLYLQAK